MTDQATWIEDGTAEVEPVTTETPADEVSADTITDPIIEASEPVEPVSVVEVDEATGTVEQEIAQKFIDAKLGEEAYQLPEGVLVPQKRGDEVEYVSIQDVLERGMRGKDYSVKTTELAEGRRSLERSQQDLSASQTRMDVRARQLDARDAELKAAMTDPQQAAAYQEHLDQYARNPLYKKNVDDALALQGTQAELEVLQTERDKEVVREASETVTGWIDGIASEYPGVNPASVRETYSLQLKAGVAQLAPEAVRSIYVAQAEQANMALSPLQTQLAEITAQLKVLQDGAAATQHNETTAHAVNRAKTIPVATGAAAPGKTTPAATKFSPNELVDRNQAWVDQGAA